VWNKPSLQEFSIEAAAFLPNMPGIADNINKDRILTEYTDSCQACSIEAQVATTTKGETTQHLYPKAYQLIKECTTYIIRLSFSLEMDHAADVCFIRP